MQASSLRSCAICAAIGTITYMPLLVLPAMVGVLVDEAGLPESFAGWVASANFFGSALIALLIAFRIHSLDLRRMARYALAIAICGEVISAYAAGPTLAFLLIRASTGLAVGAAQIAAISAIARLENIERGYGMLTTLQFIVSGIGLYLLPVYSAQLGAEGMFLCLAGFNLLAFALAGALPGRAIESGASSARGSERKILLASVTLFGLAGYAIFEGANTAQFTYVERFGVSLGFSDQQIGVAMLIASLAGIPGAFTIILLGRRFGIARPLAFGLCVSIAGLGLMITTEQYAWYFTAQICLGFAWAFCLPFIQTWIASLDPHGSAAAAGGFAAPLGIAVGPGLAAAIVGDGAYHRVFLTAIALLIVAIGSVYVSIARSRRRRPEHRFEGAGAATQIEGAQS